MKVVSVNTGTLGYFKTLISLYSVVSKRQLRISRVELWFFVQKLKFEPVPVIKLRTVLIRNVAASTLVGLVSTYELEMHQIL